MTTEGQKMLFSRRSMWAVIAFGMVISLNLPAIGQMRSLSRRSAVFSTAEFSPDGKFLAIGTYRQKAGSESFTVGGNVAAAVADSVADGVVIKGDVPPQASRIPEGAGVSVWNLETGELKAWLTHEELGESVPSVVKYSPSGKLIGAIASNTNDDALVLWDTETGKVSRVLKSDRGYGFKEAFVFLPGETRVAVMNPKGSFDVFSLRKGTILQEFLGDGTEKSLLLSPDGKRLASGFAVWDLDTEKLIAKQDDYPKAELSVFAGDGGTMYGGDLGNSQLFMWEIAKNRRSQPLMQAMRAANYSDIFCLAISGNTLITGGRDGVIGLWDLVSRTQIGHFEDNGLPVFSLAVSAQGTKLVSSGGEANVNVWDLAAYAKLHAEKKAVGLTRYSIGTQLREEPLVPPTPVVPTGKRVAEDDEVKLGHEVLVRDDAGQWHRGVVIKLFDTGKMTVHRIGRTRRDNLTVAISRLQWP